MGVAYETNNIFLFSCVILLGATTASDVFAGQGHSRPKSQSYHAEDPQAKIKDALRVAEEKHKDLDQFRAKYVRQKGSLPFPESIEEGKDRFLRLAAFEDLVDAIPYLIDLGADIEAKDQTGNNAMTYAIRRGNTLAVKQLLDLGAEIKPKGRRLIEIALATNTTTKKNILRLLDERGAPKKEGEEKHWEYSDGELWTKKLELLSKKDLTAAQKEFIDKYKCAISQKLPLDPVRIVVLDNGEEVLPHIYARDNISWWIEDYGNSPVTRQKIKKYRLQPDKELQEKISAFMEEALK